MNKHRAAPCFWSAAAAALPALTLFAAGILVASVARADNIYDLYVYCEESSIPTVILGHVVINQGAGTTIMCAGRCGGGRTVRIADVLAGANVPAEVRTALTAKVEEHQANAAAGRGRSLASCGGGGVAGEDGCKKKTVPAAIYVNAGGRITGKIQRQPGSDSPVLSSPPNGTRLVYREVRQSGGQTWYYVQIPGREAGWISGSDTACVRPPAAVIVPRIRPVDPGLTSERPTASQGGARG